MIAEIISMWANSSVPTSHSLLHTSKKTTLHHEISTVYSRENADTNIPGYICSVEMEPALFRYSEIRQQAIYRKADKPRWQIDICVSIPYE